MRKPVPSISSASLIVSMNDKNDYKYEILEQEAPRVIDEHLYSEIRKQITKAMRD